MQISGGKEKNPHATDDLLTLGNWYVLELKRPWLRYDKL
jgi:hypothetical protein